VFGFWTSVVCCIRESQELLLVLGHLRFIFIRLLIPESLLVRATVPLSYQVLVVLVVEALNNYYSNQDCVGK
jgi:hypothetical protein